MEEKQETDPLQFQITISDYDNTGYLSSDLTMTKSYFLKSKETEKLLGKKSLDLGRRQQQSDKYRRPLDLKEVLRKYPREPNQTSVQKEDNTSTFYDLGGTKSSLSRSRPLQRGRNLSRHEQYQVLMKMEDKFKKNLNFSLTNVSFYEDRKKSRSPTPVQYPKDSKEAKEALEQKKRDLEYRAEKELRGKKNFTEKLIKQKLRSLSSRPESQLKPRQPKSQYSQELQNFSDYQKKFLSQSFQHYYSVPTEIEDPGQEVAQRLQSRQQQFRPILERRSGNSVQLNVKFRAHGNESDAYRNLPPAPIKDSLKEKMKYNPLMFLLKKYEKIPANHYVKSGNRFQQLLDDYGIDPENANTPSQRTWRELKEIDNAYLAQSSTDKSSQAKVLSRPNNFHEKFEQISERITFLQNQFEQLGKLSTQTKEKIKKFDKRAQNAERQDIIGHGEDYNVADFLYRVRKIINTTQDQ